MRREPAAVGEPLAAREREAVARSGAATTVRSDTPSARPVAREPPAQLDVLARRNRSSKPCSSSVGALEDRGDEAEPVPAAAGAVVVGERPAPVAGPADAVQAGLQAGVAAGLELVEQRRERAVAQDDVGVDERDALARRRPHAERARRGQAAPLVAEDARAVAPGDSTVSSVDRPSTTISSAGSARTIEARHSVEQRLGVARGDDDGDVEHGASLR